MEVYILDPTNPAPPPPPPPMNYGNSFAVEFTAELMLGISTSNPNNDETELQNLYRNIISQSTGESIFT